MKQLTIVQYVLYLHFLGYHLLQQNVIMYSYFPIVMSLIDFFCPKYRPKSDLKFVITEGKACNCNNLLWLLKF